MHFPVEYTWGTFIIAAGYRVTTKARRDVVGQHRAKPCVGDAVKPVALKGRSRANESMGQSLVKNYVHITFSTKGRVPLIIHEIESELHSYLGGICKSLECQPLEVGGYLDHVHVLCQLSKKLALMKLVEILKSHSSNWIKTKGELYQRFYWQGGYAAFSVSPSAVDTVRRYIANQKEHHRQETFQDELLRLLRKHDIDYDERYLWD